MLFISFILSCIFCSTSFSSVYVYNDDGVSNESYRHLVKALEKKELSVLPLSAQGVLSGEWTKDAKAFFMPGGADLPYCEKLNGKGNEIIKDYVEKGGSYIGICAGSYYGGGYVEFAKGTELEVLGERELSFYPGTVNGPTLGTYYYHSDAGAYAAHIKEEESNTERFLSVYFNGGGFFVSPEIHKGVRVLYRYNNSKAQGLAAIVECSHGKGKAILTSVHVEYDIDMLWTENVNGKKPGYENLRDNVLPNLNNHDQDFVFSQILNYAGVQIR